jgi:hypothetical protein
MTLNRAVSLETQCLCGFAGIHQMAEMSKTTYFLGKIEAYPQKPIIINLNNDIVMKF